MSDIKQETPVPPESDPNEPVPPDPGLTLMRRPHRAEGQPERQASRANPGRAPSDRCETFRATGLPTPLAPARSSRTFRPTFAQQPSARRHWPNPERVRLYRRYRAGPGIRPAEWDLHEPPPAILTSRKSKAATPQGGRSLGAAVGCARATVREPRHPTHLRLALVCRNSIIQSSRGLRVVLADDWAARHRALSGRGGAAHLRC
jgi:hypothetical protein